MYGSGTYAPGARYRTLDLSARVAAASPHRLVELLFDELLVALEAAAAAERRAEPARAAPHRARATSILQVLDATLDHARGGDLARDLAAIYREAARLIERARTEKAPERIDQARHMLAEIASAWKSIDPVRNGAMPA